VFATAEPGNAGRWTISAPAGSEHGQILCELPTELSPAVRVVVGLLVQVLWSGAAASSGEGGPVGG
jgi:hypothetical protein